MSVITEYIKMHVVCALLAVGVLVGLLMPSRACAAEPVENPVTYTVAVQAGSCGGPAIYVTQTQSLSIYLHGPDTATWYERNLSSRAPVAFSTFSAANLTPDGSCETFLVTGSGGFSQTVYLSVIGVSAQSGALSITEAQQIILAALLLWGLAWGFRQFQRVGTQHHD